MTTHDAKGFTLIELMIVVAIVGILAAIAFPAYQDQIRKTRRAEGRAGLVEAANAMERFFTVNGTYTGAALGAGGIFPDTVPTDGSGTTFYNLSITGLGANAYTLNAAPTGPQTDAQCGTLTLTQTGQKGEGGTGSTADCW